MTLSREYRIYLAIWRKAYRERDLDTPLVTVNSANLSTALSLQSGMYKAVRPYRSGEAFDPELQAAAETFVVALPRHVDSSIPHAIVLKPRSTLTELEAELEALGITEADLLDPEEQKAVESIQTLIEPEASKRPSNPFFTRED